MDDQATPPIEPTTTTPDPVLGDSPVAEPLQAEPASVPETPVVNPEATTGQALPSEPITEIPTAQMGRSEPLATTASARASAEAQPVEAPIMPPTTPEPQPAQPMTASSPVPAQAQAIITLAPQSRLRDFLTKAAEVIRGRKAKKLDKIMQAIENKGKISNDEVEKLHRVSDATATRYLSELEKQGRIKQEGKTGHAVSYSKI